ncbi:MAG: T9SS type A sorting domain-containing protein [Bacteroidota bacterium]
MIKSIKLPVVFSFLILVVQGMAQCPGCVINTGCSSSPAYPTICPDTLPEGMAGQPYSEDVSFWMPVIFDDPGTGMEVTLNQLTVVDMLGLPFGLEWQTNAAANNTYYPSSNPPSTEYGCARLCGIPAFTGTYYATVYIHVEVGTAIGDQSSDDSFVLPITINPDTAGNSSFSIINSQGCGAVTASFQTNLPSNGQNGFSYAWDFGNGLNSSLENPPPQTYNIPGIYTVTCSTIVDTLGFSYLSNVTVLGCSCNDSPFSSPDLYLIITDQGGATVYTCPFVLDTDPPVSFAIPNLQMTNQNYTINVWDDDNPTSADDLCHSFIINGLSQGTSIWNGQDGISYITTHPFYTYVDTGYVTVYPAPPVPAISFIPDDSVCNGDTITLSTNAGFNYQWNNDTLVLLGGNSQSLQVTQSGQYWVMITDTNGCTASSPVQPIVIKPMPPKPAMWRTNDTLHTLAGYTLQWYLNGDPIPGASAQFYVISASGYYSLTSTLNGCTSRSDSVYYIYTGSGIGENSFSDKITVMPNPFNNELYLNSSHAHPTEMYFTVYDVLGNCILEGRIFSGGRTQEIIDFSGVSAGVYFLNLMSSDRKTIRRLIKT